MDKKDLWPAVGTNEASEEKRKQSAHGNGSGFVPDPAEALVVRARRAQLIEDIACQLTDLITIVSGRVELLIEDTERAHKGFAGDTADGDEGRRVQRIVAAVGTGMPERDGNLGREGRFEDLTCVLVIGVN